MRQVAPTIDYAPNCDPRFILQGLIDDEPRSDSEHSRCAIQIIADAPNARKQRQIFQRLLDAAKHGFGAIDAAIESNVVEQIGQVALGIGQPNDARGHRRLPHAVPTPAFSYDVVDGLCGNLAFREFLAAFADGSVQRVAITRDVCLDLGVTLDIIDGRQAGNDNWMVDCCCRKGESGFDVVRFQARKIIKYGRLAGTAGKHLQDVHHAHPHPANAGAAAAFSGLDGDA